jgi:hypothetical protein
VLGAAGAALQIAQLHRAGMGVGETIWSASSGTRARGRYRA